jgi:lycopene beta-cyclase
LHNNISNTANFKKHYDYIITGAGCAGLSLLLRILQEPNLQQKSILLIDNNAKKSNDRTWCFWENKPNFFEHLVHHQWQNLLFQTSNKKIPLNINPYTYKMIRGLDFYNYAFATIAKHSNVTVLHANVDYINSNSSHAFVIANNTTYYSNYVFNSIIFEEDKIQFSNSKSYKLLQHFKGWVIQTTEPIFNDNQAYFMDFRVPQNHDTTFVYVLPTSSTTALVEYTFFNHQLLPNNEAYDILLNEYLLTFWNLKNYSILEEEYGIIPMTNYTFSSKKGFVINIGTAGGYTKPSSGYTFTFIQKNTAGIVQKLINNQPPILAAHSKKFLWYDATLLNVLSNKKMNGDKIFEYMFSKLPASLVLKFLDNETSIWEDIKILNSVPTSIFFKAAMQEM